MSVDGVRDAHNDQSAFDPFSPAYSASDAVEVNRRLRSGPVAYSTCHGGFWPLATHRDVLDAFRRDGKELSSRHETLEDGTVLGGVVLPPMTTHLGFIEQDPPFYTPIRRALNPWFARREMAARRERIGDVAGALLDRRIASGSVEMMDDLIRPLAGIATLELLGLPLDGLATFAFPVHSASHDLTETDDLRVIWERLKGEIAAELDARRGVRSGNLIDAIRRLEVDGRQCWHITGCPRSTPIGKHTIESWACDISTCSPCRSPRSWDHFGSVLATVMGPPELPVMGPPPARLPEWSGPAVCDQFRSFDLEVAGGVPGGSGARGTRGSAALVE